LTELPTGSSRDAAITSLSNKVISTDPDGADQWAESISDPQVRQAQVTTILKKWMQTDAASASVAVQKSSLPANVKTQLLQPSQ
jgi:hypothetical protein